MFFKIELITVVFPVPAAPERTLNGFVKICLQILRHESLKYGQEKDKIYGILFDGAWLWEEYLNTIFVGHQLGITHAENKTGKNGIQLYDGGKKCYYPDFYKQTQGDLTGDSSFVLDAKYKRLGVSSTIDDQKKLKNSAIKSPFFIS